MSSLDKVAWVRKAVARCETVLLFFTICAGCACLALYDQESSTRARSQEVMQQVTLRVLTPPSETSPELVIHADRAEIRLNTYNEHYVAKEVRSEPHSCSGCFQLYGCLFPTRNVTRVRRETRHRIPDVWMRVMAPGTAPTAPSRLNLAPRGDGEVVPLVVNLVYESGRLPRDREATLILTSNGEACTLKLSREVVRAIHDSALVVQQVELARRERLRREQEERQMAEERERQEATRRIARDIDIEFGMPEATVRSLVGEPDHTRPYTALRYRVLLYRYAEWHHLELTFRHSHLTGYYRLVGFEYRPPLRETGKVSPLSQFGDSYYDVKSDVKYVGVATGRFRRISGHWHLELYYEGRRIWGNMAR